MDIIKVFGINVKKYRVSCNMFPEKLAEKSNLHTTYISAIECFRRNKDNQLSIFKSISFFEE